MSLARSFTRWEHEAEIRMGLPSSKDLHNTRWHEDKRG